MPTLEFECTNCEDVLLLDVTLEEREHYINYGSFKESSEAYQDFFNGQGWVLQQDVYCDTCKYDHSEVYADFEPYSED